MIVTVKHASEIPYQGRRGYCVPGLRKFCARHNINFRDFVRNGIDSEELIKTGDHQAMELVHYVKEYYGAS